MKAHLNPSGKETFQDEGFPGYSSKFARTNTTKASEKAIYDKSSCSL